MKLLIDNALSPQIARGLCENGYDAVHVRQLGMGNASDESIFQWCLENDHVVVSADTDFGILLAQCRGSKPSVLLLRRIAQQKPRVIANILLVNLLAITEPLEGGSVVVIEENRIRVRSLPIFGASFSPKNPR